VYGVAFDKNMVVDADATSRLRNEIFRSRSTSQSDKNPVHAELDIAGAGVAT
jgi:hypothetical protein